MRSPLAVAVLAMLLALPAAAAGSEEEPEVRGNEDKPNPAGDVVAAWLSGEEEGVRIHVQVASLPEGRGNLVCWISLGLGATTIAPTVGLDSGASVRTDNGEHGSMWGGPGAPARVDDSLLDPSAEPGTPGTLTAVVPWGLYPGLAEGARLRVNFAACSLHEQGLGWIAPYDEERARSGTVFVASAEASKGFFPILVPGWVLPTIVVGCTLGGAALGYALSRRHR